MVDVTEKDYELLQRIMEVEASMPLDEFTLGWRWYEVQAHTAHINKLIVNGLVIISFKSNSETRYQLTEKGKLLAATDLPGDNTEQEKDKNVLPETTLDFSSMFSDIIGYDDIKELIFESLQLDKPIHVLLVGPPALAKTMFIWDIERVFGEQAMPLLGSATSHAGLWDLIGERRPRIILVDEIEKMALTDQAALLSVMETGRLIRAKVGRKMDIQLTAWVIAAANRIHKMPPELLSRFAIHRLAEYNNTEFREVVAKVLESREEIEHNTAAEIATRLVGRTHDVRDAVRVARLSKRTGVERAVELLLSQ